MPAHYFFQDFKRFEHLEQFLRHHIQKIVDHFIPNERYALTTRVHTVRGRQNLKQPKFLFEIMLNSPQNTVPIIIKKIDANFYRAAYKSAHVLKIILQKESSYRSSHHRREYRKIEKLDF